MKRKTINSLYIHIPFCNAICPYCDFAKAIKREELVKPYLSSLIHELKSLKINHKLKTIYIGGGTPTSIDLSLLLNELDKYIDKSTEFTIEGNVLDFNNDLLKLYKSHHVNRISLGVQSTNNMILKVLGRNHTRSDVINKIKLIKKYIKNINIDLIYGFKELSEKILIDELKDYIALDVKHISTYSLEIHEGTKFYNEKRKELDDNKIRKQFDIIFKYLTKHKFVRYEISNFSKLGYESKHNLTYWNNDEYYGIGLGAASYVNGVRGTNTRNITSYINKKYNRELEKINLSDDKKYTYMLNLRKSDGISLNEYKKKYKIDLLKEKPVINKLIKQKLLVIKNKNLITTYNGSMLLDIILRELF